MARINNHTVRRLDATILEMLEREGVAKEVNGSWFPVPWAKDIVSRFDRLTRCKGWNAELSGQCYYLFLAIIAGAKDVGKESTELVNKTISLDGRTLACPGN